MNDFECLSQDDCQVANICRALSVHGVDIENGANEDGDCAVKNMFDVSGSGIGKPKVEFNPAMKEDHPETLLIGELGRAAYNIMSREASPEKQEMIALHESVLESRIDMWKAMLQAPKEGRTLTAQELKAHEDEIRARTKKVESKEVDGEGAVLAVAGFDSMCLDRYNLLFDSEMIRVVNRVVGNMMDGQPTLVVGDKGIAKTSVAKFVSQLSHESEPLIISGHGDMGTHELIGEIGLADGKTYFKEGKVPQAAREGRQIILDEVDVSDVAVMLRLQDILLNIKPGKELILQENGQGAIRVEPGFGVVATANEASKRYKHRQVSDPANRDRYDIIRLDYPDKKSNNNSTDVLGRQMTNLRRLAYAAVSDDKGNISGVTGEELEQIVTLASATQHLYREPATSAMRQVAGIKESTTDVLDDTEPLMSDCITPRRLYTDLVRLAPGNKPGFTFKNVVDSLIERLNEGDQAHNSEIAQNLWKEIAKK